MATANKKTYFGEETKTNTRNNTRRTAKTATTTKARYAKVRARRTTTRRNDPHMVTITVPANFAFRLGVMLGQANA